MTVRSLSLRAVCLLLPTAVSALVATFVPAISRGAHDAAPAAGEKMSDTWSRTEPVADPPDANFGEWHFWVQDGWLMAERRIGDDIEWKVVLAKVVGDELPTIVVNRSAPPGLAGSVPGGLRLGYRDGRYFIRDEFGSLRCVREEKTEGTAWPEMQLPPRDEKPRFGNVFAPRLGNVISQGWIVAHAGPQRPSDRMVADCLLRLAHQDLEEPDGLKVTVRPGVRRLTRGRWFVVDDGELLVAERLETHDLQNEINRRAEPKRAVARATAERKMRGSPPPELSGVWLNTEKPPRWESLRGKPVLLVLFDFKQPTFLPLVAPLLGFHEMYGKQGLEVIGVYENGPRDEIEKRLAEERIKFPVLIDDGKTAERYGIGFSACLLIDRDGKVVSVYKDSLAPPAEIEKLLGREKGS